MFEEGQSSLSRSVLTGDVTAVDNIDIEEDNTINGNVTAGNNVNNQGTVNGTITQNGNVQNEPLPALNFSAGEQDITIPNGGSRTLAPGSYGDVEVGRNAQLNLSSGDYFFETLDLKSGARMLSNVNGGAVTVNVEDQLDIAKDVRIFPIPFNLADSDKITINCQDGDEIDVGRRSRILGTLVAPDAHVTLEEDVLMKGAICADDISVEKDVRIVHHSFVLGPSAAKAISFADEMEGEDVFVEDEAAALIPTVFELGQNYPNPFNPSTTITFVVPGASEVTLTIYNTLGQLVATLHTGPIAAGYHNAVWDGKDFRGASVAGGVYIYRLKANSGFVATRRLLLMK